MRMTSSTKCLRPIYLLYLSCFGLFVLQMGLLIQSRLHPEKTISSTELKKLGEIPFPAIFRICLKPAYNETFLRQAGYETAWRLFTGKQISARKKKRNGKKHQYNDISSQAAVNFPMAHWDGLATQRRAKSFQMYQVDFKS